MDTATETYRRWFPAGLRQLAPADFLDAMEGAQCQGIRRPLSVACAVVDAIFREGADWAEAGFAPLVVLLALRSQLSTIL